MIIKLAAFILIVGATSYLGFCFSASFKKREETLGKLIICLTELSSLICHIKAPLMEAFKKIQSTCDGEAKEFFGGVVCAMEEGKTVQNAAKAHYFSLASLKKEDLSALSDFFQSLGSLDVTAQMEHISLLKQRLYNGQKEAEKEREKYEKLIKSSGVMSGLAVFLLLI